MSEYKIAVIIESIPFTDLEVGELVLVNVHEHFANCYWDKQNSRCEWCLLHTDFEILGEL